MKKLSFLSKTIQFMPIILFGAFLIHGCSGQSVDNTLENYRVQIGGKECTFELQMLYLIASLEVYRLHVGEYPSNENNLKALISKPEVLEGTGVWKGPYADTDAILFDPWQRKLHYSVDESGKVELRSLGPDGKKNENDLSAQEMYPSWYREMEKLSQYGPIPLQPLATPKKENQ